jgi:hypothetical protein
MNPESHQPWTVEDILALGRNYQGAAKLATEGGGTFTFGELREDLVAAGFAEVALARQDEAMNAIVLAKKPAAGSRGLAQKR